MRALAACSCDKLWHRLCLSTWPNVAIARHAPPAHLRVLPPVDSWRHLYRARVAAATPADAWRELLPLYDESTLVATQRHEGWVVEVGILLNRIMRWRERHNLPIAPAREEMVHDGRISESYCWSQTMQHELTGGIGEIVAVAHEVVGVPEGTILDAGWAWILEAVDALDQLLHAECEDELAVVEGLVRVAPGDPDRSFLYVKVTDPGGMGEPMPPFRALPDEQVELIRRWIEDGAEP